VSAGIAVDRFARLKEFAQSRVVFVAFHLCLLGYFFGVTPDLRGTLLVWFVLQFGVHAGFHRYFAHRSYRTHHWFEVLMGMAGCLAYQSGPIWWSSKHRSHHQHADTAMDHHSPVKSFWHAHIGWLWVDGAADIDWRYVRDLRRPIPLWLESMQFWIHTVFIVICFFIGGWSGILNWWVAPIVICWHTTFSTNSICHIVGSHAKACHPLGVCNARNNAVVAILNLGEGWHNNHHANPAVSHHGFYRWYQIDIIYSILVVLERLGIVWDLKRARRID
jgi:stearoyl-CoA desaturase (delta-9 desaturase)